MINAEYSNLASWIRNKSSRKFSIIASQPSLLRLPPVDPPLLLLLAKLFLLITNTNQNLHDSHYRYNSYYYHCKNNSNNNSNNNVNRIWVVGGLDSDYLFRQLGIRSKYLKCCAFLLYC